MMSTTLSYDGEAISAVEAAKFMSILHFRNSLDPNNGLFVNVNFNFNGDLHFGN